MHAGVVDIGDCVRVLNAGLSTPSLRPRRVMSIAHFIRQGAYAPLTNDGRLMVNNVQVSCYAVVHDHSLAHGYFQLVATVYRWVFGVTGSPVDSPHDTHLPAYVHMIFDCIHHLLPDTFYAF